MRFCVLRGYFEELKKVSRGKVGSKKAPSYKLESMPGMWLKSQLHKNKLKKINALRRWLTDKFIKENNIFSGKVLDEKKVDESVFDFNLWNVNSSNFDYRQNNVKLNQ